MGYAISWLAVRESISGPLLEELGLSATGEMDQQYESLYTGRALPTGWFILLIDKCQHKFVQPSALEALSKLGDVIACSIEEHVMWSSAELWSNGAPVWSIEHDAQIGMSHIAASGTLPDVYSAIEGRFVAQQEESGGDESDVDYIFEIPLQVAKTIAGFKHDDAPTDEGQFVVFTEKTSSSPADSAASKKKRPW